MNPYSVQVEFVEGCNRMCRFCGIHSIWKEEHVRNYMSKPLAYSIAKDLGGWLEKARIEFAMHGEPTLHPRAVEYVNEFREHNPGSQLQMTTNGYGLRKNGPGYVNDLFSAGLNILLVDLYSHVEQTVQICRDSDIKVLNYYDKDCINPYYNNGPKTKVIILMGDLGQMTGVKAARKILNHAGNVSPEIVLEYNGKVAVLPLNKKCSRVFREMAIHYDGTVSVCCMDWRHEFVVGDISEGQNPKKIWESEPFKVVRYFLRQGKRFFRPCYKCDYAGGFRLGLLPEAPNPFHTEDGAIELIKRHLQFYNNRSKFSDDPFIKIKKGFPL